MAYPSIKYFITPFASGGDVTVTPNGVQVSGSVSYTQGYGPDYQLDPATDPSALDIDRAQNNGLYNDITVALQYWEQNSIAYWIDATTNGGSSYAYPIGAVVQIGDGNVYISRVAANVVTPPGAGWEAIGTGVSATSNLTTNVNLTPGYSGRLITNSANAVTATMQTTFPLAGQMYFSLNGSHALSITVPAGANLIGYGLNFSNQTLVLPAENNGHLWIEYAEGGDYLILSISPGVAAYFGISNAALPVNGQCYLTLSGGNLKLSPHNGQSLQIAGTSQLVPSAGVTLGAGGLTPGTLYYIYAFMNSGTMTLEASATAYAVSTTTGNVGVVIKSGDNTRTLVGMAVPTSGPAFVAYQVVSWFNKQWRKNSGNFSTNRSTTSTSFVEINSEIRTPFLAWSGDQVRIDLVGNILGSVATGVYFAGIGFDSATPEAEVTGSGAPAVSANGFLPAALGFYKTGLAEGVHYATVLGAVGASGGTATFSAATAPASNTAAIQLDVQFLG